MPPRCILSSPGPCCFSCKENGFVRVQAIILVLFISLFSACSRSSEELPVRPPVTHPLTREFIGFGVITASFAHLLNEPDPAGVSLGHLRRGTVVRIVERRPFVNRGIIESWVLVEGNYDGDNVSRGWLQEISLDIYDNESQARTASRSISL